jgi:hypothetical protein
MGELADDIAFSLVNSDAVEIIESNEELDLGTQTEQEFSHVMCAGYLGRVGTLEFARNLGKEIKRKLKKPGPLIANSPTRLLLIPHHFYLRSATSSLLRTISSVGLIVDFLPGDETFSIIDLLPNSRFKRSFEARAQGDIGIRFSTLLNLFVPEGVGDTLAGVIDEKHNKRLFGFSLDFGHTFFATEVTSVGVGTTTAIFEFFNGSEPLVGNGLTAWSAVAFNQHSTELVYRVKLFYTSRIGVIPKRCESDWIQCKATI